MTGNASVPAPGADQIDPFSDPSLTACGADNAEDFAVVSDTTCTVATDPDGTLRYSVSARVRPLPLQIGSREVRMTLAVTRDGRVLEQP